jgi:hypothetical protein
MNSADIWKYPGRSRRRAPEVHVDSAPSPEDAERLDNVSPVGWRSPKPLSVCHLLAIGAGPAGLAAARPAAALGACVALIEHHQIGGDCLNDGCIPSKSLIRTGRLLADMRVAPDHSLFDPRPVRSALRVAQRPGVSGNLLVFLRGQDLHRAA